MSQVPLRTSVLVVALALLPPAIRPLVQRAAPIERIDAAGRPRRGSQETRGKRGMVGSRIVGKGHLDDDPIPHMRCGADLRLGLRPLAAGQVHI